MSLKLDPSHFEKSLLHLVNEVLPTLQPRVQTLEAALPDTPLFTTGRLDSLSVLHLIGAIEELTGTPVPDRLVSMKYFHSIETLTLTFCHEQA